MTTSSAALLESLEQVVSLFNRGSLDLPDGFLHRNASFRLNGVAYDEAMGRSGDDPLVRLIARGPGAYRFLAKALRYALPDASVSLGPLERGPREDGFTLTGTACLTGTPRTEAASLRTEAGIRLQFDPAARLVGVDLVVNEQFVGAIQAARAG